MPHTSAPRHFQDHTEISTNTKNMSGITKMLSIYFRTDLLLWHLCNWQAENVAASFPGSLLLCRSSWVDSGIVCFFWCTAEADWNRWWSLHLRLISSDRMWTGNTEPGQNRWVAATEKKDSSSKIHYKKTGAKCVRSCKLQHCCGIAMATFSRIECKNMLLSPQITKLQLQEGERLPSPNNWHITESPRLAFEVGCEHLWDVFLSGQEAVNWSVKYKLSVNSSECLLL